MDLQILSLGLGTYQIYGLVFLLGSLAVATISDLKKMAAQKEFFQFWLIFTIGMFALDAYPMLQSGEIQNAFVFKWIIIGAFCLLSHSDKGVIFKLGKMDIAAMTAVASLFNLYSVIIFIPLTKIVSILEKPLLRRGGRYPFIPVIFTSVSLILAVNVFFPGG